MYYLTDIEAIGKEGEIPVRRTKFGSSSDSASSAGD